MTARFARFTERARRVLSVAQERAQRFHHDHIGTEHILLGLVQDEECAAARTLSNLSIAPSKVRSAVESIVGRGEQRPLSREIGLTPRAKKVIELAVDEARRLNHHHIGTEHLLIGLLREGEGVAAGVLESLGASLDRVRSKATWNDHDTDPRREAAQKVAGLYVIVDPELTRGRDVIEVARAALRGGATAIQLRDKAHDKGDQLPVARRLRDLCQEFGASFIVNDHADLAVACDAHGLHVGQHDLPVPEARRILYPNQFLGTSNALLEEAQASVQQGADYIAVGAIYSTGSKAITRPAGIQGLRRVTELVSGVPIVAIGGITSENVGPVLEAGADGICVIGAVCLADDPEQAARRLVERIAEFRAGTTGGSHGSP